MSTSCIQERNIQLEVYQELVWFPGNTLQVHYIGTELEVLPREFPQSCG